MDVPSRQRLYNYMASAFRTVVPRPENRIPLNKETWPHLLSPVLPILLMAYLVRRPNTHVLRILIFPVVLFTSLRAGYGYGWPDPRHNVYNFGGALSALAVISRALEYALAVNGIKKIDETVPGQRADPAIAAGSKAPRDASPSKRPLGDIILIPLSDAIEVLWNMRGIGFEYGRDVTIPPETRPLQKQPFLWATFRIFLVNFLTLDFIDTVLKLTPPLRSPMGGSIFIPSLPMPTRYLVSTCLHFATGCGIVAGFKMCYSLLTIFGVLVFSHSPSVWPPVFNNPWTASSLHDFWARRWHQVFRHTFMVYGGFPGKWIGELIGGRSLGRVGVVLGTFLASGLFHELGMWAMGQGLDWHVRKFFIIQSFLVLGERAWSRMTGKRVGGWLGCLWVYFAIVVLGQPCVDAWHRRGLGGGVVIPPAISPVRRILLPTVGNLIQRLRT